MGGGAIDYGDKAKRLELDKPPGQNQSADPNLAGKFRDGLAQLVMTSQPQTAKPEQVDGDKVLGEVLKENPVFARTYDPKKTSVVFADADRISALKKSDEPDSQLEFWPPEETGAKNFPRPKGTEGKHVLEIYNPGLKASSSRLKDAIYGDLLHGLDSDPYYSSLKKQFIENYAPQTKKQVEKLKKQGRSDKSINDMYIRGKLAKNQGAEWDEPGRYSPRQLEIIKEMQRYLSTGVAPKDFKPSQTTVRGSQ